MRWTPLFAAAALAACGQSETATPELELETPPPVAEDASTAEDAMIVEEAYLDGTHCYFNQNETVTEGLTVTFNTDGSAAGRHFGTIHDEASAYYTAFDVALSEGEVGEASTVNFSAVIEVDGDTQFENTDWVITEASASEVGVEKTLNPTECDGLIERVWPPIAE